LDFNNIHPIHATNVWNDIYFAYYENGEKKYSIIEKYKTYFWSSTANKPIIPKNLATQVYSSNIYNDKEKYDNTYEADFSASKRFMIDQFKDIATPIEQEIRIAYFDIENLIEKGRISTKGEKPITAITVLDSKTNTKFTFAYYEKYEKIDKENKIRLYRNEVDMLNDFLKFMDSCKFDVFCGWNSSTNALGTGYDIPYLCNRLDKFGLLEKISPFGKVKKITNDKDEDSFIIYGINLIDYMDIYKKYKGIMGETVFSNSLNTAAEEELNDKKIEYDSDLDTLYRNNIDKYIEYNRHDVQLIKDLEDKLGYIKIMDEIRRIAFVNIEDASSNSIVIDNILIRILNKNNCIVRSKGYNEKQTFPGAFVKEVTPGIYDWVVCLDFASLYPHIIMNFNISPETKIKSLPENDAIFYKQKDDEIFAPSNVLFKKNVKGVFPGILHHLYQSRVNYKDLRDKEEYNTHNYIKYNNLQQAYKILLNSFYGFVGYQQSRFFDIDLAKSVTLTGQHLIKHIYKLLEAQGYTVIAGDTDSVYITGKDLIDQESAIKRGEEISKELSEGLKGYLKTKFGVENSTFNFSYEKSSKRGCFFAKKNYILHLVHKDGKKVDKMDYKGVACKKSDTDKYAQVQLKKIYESMLREFDLDKVYKLIEEFRNGVDKVPVEEIGQPISINKDIEEYASNTIHVRGAKVWEAQFAKTYNKSFENESKGRLYYIKNVFNKDEKLDPVICIPERTKMPSNIIIDYDTMREKVVELRLVNLFEIIDNIKVKKLLPEYINYTKEEIVNKLYIEMFEDLKKVDYLLRLEMVSFNKRFINYVNELFLGKLFIEYCKEKKINCILGEEFVKKIDIIKKTVGTIKNLDTLKRDVKELKNNRYF
jgi:DNA polymerase elongation subunit (family B)